MSNIFTRLGQAIQHGWSMFNGRDRPPAYVDYGPSFSYRPDKKRIGRWSDRTIISAIYNRIALDVVSIDIHHVKLDENGRYREIVNDGLEKVLSLEANIDQTRFTYMLDVVLSLFDEGAVAEVPVECDVDPRYTSGYDILQMRTGKILEWFPQHVRVRLYNERTGQQEEVILPKSKIAIHENPFYSVMNEPMGILQRLKRKMDLIDIIDEQNSGGKMNMILQLPYVVKSEAQRKLANTRIAELENQLNNSKYGVAYTDGTEKVVQLNRPLENSLMEQVKYLTDMLYSQLGITASILDGTADEKTMLNYYNRTIEPIVAEIVNERKRKFLSKTARTQGESVMYFRDPFKLTPVTNLADIADKLTRNAILTSNEFRAIIGYKPVDNELANELSNKNMPAQDQEDAYAPEPETGDTNYEEQGS